MILFYFYKYIFHWLWKYNNSINHSVCVVSIVSLNVNTKYISSS